MTIRASLLSATVALFLLSACSDPKTIQDLETRIKELEDASATTKDKLQTLEKEVKYNELVRDWDAIAYLEPSADGYSVVRSDLGLMTVRLTDVKPYANGSRVILEFGNVSGATINGLKAKVDWGRVDDDGSPKADGEKTREITFDKKLKASAWTNVPVTLEGIPPAQLGYVRVSQVSHLGIELAR